jgi:ribosomal protein S21
MINAEVQKQSSENSMSVIRRFTRRVQGTGLVRGVRADRYHERTRSKTVVKKKTLKSLIRRANYRQLIKEGKVVEKVQRTNHAPRENTTTQPSASRFGETTPIAR